MELKVTSGTGMKLGKTRVLERLLVIDDTATCTLSPTYSGSDPGKMTITDTFPANYIDIMSGDTNGWACTITHQTLTRTKKLPPAGADGDKTSAGDNISVGDIAYTATVSSIGNHAPNQAEIVNTNDPTDQNGSNNTANEGGADLQMPRIDFKAAKLGPSPNLGGGGKSIWISVKRTK